MTHRLGWALGASLSIAAVGACGGDSFSETGDLSAAGAAGTTGDTGGIGGTDAIGGTHGNTGGTGGSVSNECSPDRERCGTECVSLYSDPSNCGACGRACEPDAVCSAGTCVSTCPAGWTLCGNSCVENLQTDSTHCGSCGRACPAGQGCIGGNCSCLNETIPCAGQCVDPLTNREHCGACFNPCTLGPCLDGVCQSGAGGSGGTGGFGTGGVGIGGTGGSPTPCVDPDSDAPYQTQSTVTGANGEFTDACDAQGNLIEYACETGCGYYPDVPVPYGGSAGIGVPCMPVPTGSVVPQPVDCGGQCVDGTCASHCPVPGDQIRYEAQVGEVVTLQNLTKDRTYSCTIIFDRADDGYECGGAERIGTLTEVCSLGISSLFCNATELGNIGTDDPTNTLMQECTFACTTVASW